MLNFIEVKNDKLLDVLNNLAIIIWNEYYTPILGDFKVNYMLESIHNKENIKKEIESGYRYYILQKDEQNIGYMAFAQKNDNVDIADANAKNVFLSKLYLSKPFRNQGLGKMALEFIINHEISKEANQIWLMVNKKSADTIKTYERFGFKCRKEVQSDIGKGYIIDECVMVKELKADKIA